MYMVDATFSDGSVQLRELTDDELSVVSGGVALLVVLAVATLVLGVIALVVQSYGIYVAHQDANEALAQAQANAPVCVRTETIFLTQIDWEAGQASGSASGEGYDSEQGSIMGPPFIQGG
jgi:hypothetical protein